MKESCNFELGSLKKKKKKEEEEKEKEKDEQEEERKKAFGLVLLQCFFALLVMLLVTKTLEINGIFS